MSACTRSCKCVHTRGVDTRVHACVAVRDSHLQQSQGAPLGHSPPFLPPLEPAQQQQYFSVISF